MHLASLCDDCFAELQCFVRTLLLGLGQDSLKGIAREGFGGLVSLARGAESAQRGFLLTRPPSQISLRDVVEALEGPILLSECLQARGEDDCPFRTNCPVRTKWGRVQVAMMREMAAITFEDLAQEALGISLAMPVFAS